MRLSRAQVECGLPERVHRTATVFAIIAGLAGCVTASVESRPLSPEELTNPQADQRLEGVVYYQPRPYLLVYQYTQFDSSTPKPVRGSPPPATPPAPVVPPAPAVPAAPADTTRCIRTIQRTDLEILPDFAHPRLLTPKRHGIGTVRLSVTLSSGMISGVNAEGASTFAEALKALTAGTGDVAAVIRGAALAVPRCNASPVLSAILPVRWGGDSVRIVNSQ